MKHVRRRDSGARPVSSTRSDGRTNQSWTAKKQLLFAGLVLLLLLVAWLCHGYRKSAEKRELQNRTNAGAHDVIRPETLDELLALNPDQLEKVDIARINLLCAVGLRGSEHLDVERCIGTLDAWAANIDWQTKRNLHRFSENPAEYNNSLAYYRMGMIGTILVQDMRVQYNPEFENEQQNESIAARSLRRWNVFFSNSRDIFLHGLLTEKRHGTCSSMPFLYVAIGRRLGYPVYVAGRKYHLYARYEEGNGKHLNVEATENQGFSTPTDEEYRDMGYVMTDEEIRSHGWLRPLSNKEILGVCLQMRSSCLRSMKRYDEATATLTQALRYVPDSAFMQQVIEKEKALSDILLAEDRCNELWNKLADTPFPARGPKCDYFRIRKQQVELLANHSTNAAEVEQGMVDLIRELKEYRATISDFPEKLVEVYSPHKEPPDQQNALDISSADGVVRQIRLPEEMVPVEYRRRIPAELMNRLRKLSTERDVIEEMHVYAVEELRLEDLSMDQDRRQNELRVIQMRRRLLDQETPFVGRPLQIEILPKVQPKDRADQDVQVRP